MGDNITDYILCQ